MNRCGVATSPFGRLLLAESEAGLCWLSFVNNSEEAESTRQAQFPSDTRTQHNFWSQSVVDQWIENLSTVPLAAAGTLFQKVVWNELLNTSLGETLSYSELARRIGKPTAVRAVASAVARNPIALFIPCHRVLPKNGSVGNYRWGSEKKEALLKWEENR